jgi:hypothetical protein
MDVNAMVYCGNNKDEITFIEQNATLNVKRVFVYNENWILENAQGAHYIMDAQEIKTTWHPIENIGGGGVKY